MLAKNNKIIKLISSLLIITILTPAILFSMPKQVQAQGLPTMEQGPLSWIRTILLGTSTGSTVTDTAISIKNVAKEILKQIVMTVAKRFLQKMTTSTINWINSGFHGSPLFVENPQSFFRDIAKFQIKDFVDLTGYNNSKFPFGREFALSTIGAYKRQFSDNAQYTLSKVINDPQLLYRFQTDFDIGGWNGFLTNTQYPQNNYLGYRMLATEELARRLDGTAVSAANRVEKTLQQGMGFLSPQTCPTNPNYNNGKNEFQKPTFKETTQFHFEYPIRHETPTGDCRTPMGLGVEDTTQAECRAKGGTWTIVPGRPGIPESDPEYDIRANAAYDEQEAAYKAGVAKEKSTWAEKNDCPGGLKATTPGSVVGNSIMTALSSNYRQSELAMAMGTSISAIIDALLNKFLGDGLTALATKTNPKAPADDWEYEGQTLGSPADGVNDEWNMGPDEEIVLSDFKKQLEGRTVVTTSTSPLGACTVATGIKLVLAQNMCLENGGTWVAYSNSSTSQETTIREEIGDTGNGEYIPGDIANTEAEIFLIDNPVTCDPIITTTVTGVTTTVVNSACNPGLTQMMGKIWPQARTLDICQPGPDLGWKERIVNEMNRNGQKLQGKTSDSDGNKAAKATLAFRELKFAVDFFKDWIINNMMTELPNSVLYMDAVDEIGELAQQADELTDRKRARTQALGRLEAIKAGLDAITTLDSDGRVIQPPVGSANEKILVSLRKQYNANKIAVSNSNTVDEMKNGLVIAKEKLLKLTELTKECSAARVAKGWSVQGGPSSLFTSKTTSETTTTTTSGGAKSGNEKGIFCDAPINGGYDHESFTHANDKPLKNKTHPEVPYVNSNDVLKWKRWGGIFGNYTVDIELSCNIIWKANVLDYKGNLPGTTQIGNDYILPDDTTGSELGTCSNVFDGTGTLLPEESGIAKDQCNTAGGDWAPNEPVPQPEPEPQQ